MDPQIFFTNYEFDQMSKYLQMISHSLPQEFEQLENAYKENMEREIVDNADTYQDRYKELGGDFTQQILGSFIVTWYSFVEQKLLDVCGPYKLKISISVKEDVNLGEGIWRAKKFLGEAANYKMDEKHWQELLNINRLRNFIVQRGYQLTPVYFYKPEGPFVKYEAGNGIPTYFSIEADLNSYLQSYSLVNYSPTQLAIIPTLEYCQHLVDFGKGFFKGIFEKLQKSKS